MSDDRDIGYAICGFFFGIWAFFWGFKRLRRKRLIENIPTSTVRALAMGLVELCGKAKEVAPLKSPLTKTECVLFHYLVEEYRSSGKSGHWVTIASGDSFYCPFWIDDGTGRVMVFARGAELILPVSYEFSLGFGGSFPENLKEFMAENGIGCKGWIGNRQLRFKEWFIVPDETVYVMGSAKKNDIPAVDYKDILIQRIKELKQDPQKMKEADLDKDGRISTEEWDLAAARLEKQVLDETLKEGRLENPADVVVGKGDVETVFMISDHSEKDLTNKLFGESILGIYGGTALSLATLTYLLFRLRTFIFK